jgi:hypothetical protein
MRISIPVVLFAAGLVGLACSDPNAIPPATLTNVTDTVVVGALIGTPVQVPSAYSIPDRRPVRTDQSASFDFVYNVDGAGSPVFLSQGVLGLTPAGVPRPGFLATTQTFEAITTAPSNGYVTDDTIHVAVGDRYILRSRVVCTTLGVPLYGKLEVLEIDPVARTLKFQVLDNNNCGYRDLSPGIPQH